MPKIIDFGIAKAAHQRLTEKTVFTRYAEGTRQRLARTLWAVCNRFGEVGPWQEALAYPRTSPEHKTTVDPWPDGRFAAILLLTGPDATYREFCRGNAPVLGRADLAPPSRKREKAPGTSGERATIVLIEPPGARAGQVHLGNPGTTALGGRTISFFEGSMS